MSLAATGRLFLLYNGTQFVHKSVITGHKSEAVCDIEMRPSCMFRGWGGGNAVIMNIWRSSLGCEQGQLIGSLFSSFKTRIETQ